MIVSFLSPDGKSFTFDSRANGYGRGDGVATIVVKRLSDAVAAGDPIRAVIRETHLNQDGKTETITSPSEAAQVALIRDCYHKAGLDPRGTQYFEAHGTGTPTGDPIEARAIAAVFRQGRPADDPLRIGSVKTNIGHTEPTSGLASVIKVAMALEMGVIPPSINFEKANPKLALEDWRLRVAQGLEPWPSSEAGEIPRASINSFGYGGSNAHVILEQAESWLRDRTGVNETTTNGVHASTKGTATNGVDGSTNGVTGGNNIKSIEGYERPKYKAKVFILSARDEQACQRMVSNLKEHLEQNPPTDPETYLQSLAYTLGQRRTLFPWVAAHTLPYTCGIDEVIKGLASPKFKPRKTSGTPRIGMVFTGQGAQWHAMGRELMVPYPVFKASLEEADRFLRELGAGWSLMQELCRDAETTRINDAAISVACSAALQISLVRLLRSWGIKPTAVTSHSSGEIAAAYTVGALSYREAMAVAYHRGVLVADQSLRGSVKGGMVAVGLGLQETERYLQRLTCAGKAVPACINSPQSVTVAGDVDAVAEIEAMAKEDGVFARRLKVDTGFHSHHMRSVAGPYSKALCQVFSKSEGAEADSAQDMLDSISFSSPLLGGRVFSPDALRDPVHWVDSLVQPVLFVDAFTDMVLGDGNPSGSSVDVIVEVGPHTALGGPIRQILDMAEFKGIQLPYYGCLVRNTDARDSMQELAANLMREGLSLDLQAVNFPWGRSSQVRVLTDLPSYPWNHQIRHWREPRFNKAIRERSAPPHDLLGQLVPGTNPESPSWRHILRTTESAWVRDHVVQSNVLYPGAGFVCLAIEAMKQISEREAQNAGNNGFKAISGYRLRDIDILQALVVPDEGDGVEIQTTLRPVSDKAIGARGWKQFDVSSVGSDNRWTQHASGIIRVEFDNEDKASADREGGSRAGSKSLSGYTRRLDPDDLYGSLRAVGISHGPIFRTIDSIVQSGTEPRALSTFVVPDTSATKQLAPTHVVHPTTLDVVVHGAYAALPSAGAHEESAKIPRSIENLWVSAGINREAGHKFHTHYYLTRADGQSFQADISVVDDEGSAPVLEIQGLLYQSLGRSVRDQQAKPWEREVCSKIEWAADMTLQTPASLKALEKELAHRDDPSENRLIMDLRRVCIYFILETLASLSASDVSGLESHHTKFYTWMQDQVALAASGMLGPDSATWALDSAAERQRRIEECAEASVNGEMVCHLGPHLAAILRREASPLELMMQRDKLLYRFYGKALKSERCFGDIAVLLRKLVHKNPRARILEIGGGTGGATRYCLKALGTAEEGGPLAESYHFTDLSSGFFEAAREEFAPWSQIMTFGKLNIEQDPAGQEGVVPGSYDIVIACEVLHATRSMTNTMANVRKLLKPGGKLILGETTQDQLDLQLIFGLLPGWWLSEEPERQSSPSLSTPFWGQVLEATGFTGVDLEIRDCETEDTYSLSTILSTAKPENGTSPASSEEVVIVTSSKTPVPPSWLESLQLRIATKAGSSLPAVLVLEETTNAGAYSGKTCIFLGEVEQPILYNLDAASLQAIKVLATSCKGLIWVTRGGAVECANPHLGLAPGLLRSLRNEYVGRQIVTLDLDPAPDALWSENAALAVAQVLHASLAASNADATDAPPGEFEFAERGGSILVPRCYRDVARNRKLASAPAADDPSSSTSSEPFHQPDRALIMHVGVPGLLDTLAFGDDPNQDVLESPSTVSEEADMVEVEPRAYGVNFRDVMVAMGQLNERVMGLECAGVITHVGNNAAAQGYAVGDKVVCLLGGPSFASRARVEWRCVMRMPPELGDNFEEAASLPVIFCTAYMCLVDTARLQRGQSILIHAAAGGVGQAAVMLAKHLGADVFVTVGTPEKKELVMSRYGIPAERIFNSRDTSFAAGVLAATGGRGVDVVLNSLAGPLLQESFNVLAPFGHFVEIGKRDLEQNSWLEMRPFTRQTSFSSFDLLTVSRLRGGEVHRVLTDIARLTSAGVVKPVYPVTAYPIAEVSKALRVLQAGKHTGKVVLSAGPAETVPVLPRVRKAKLSAHASYLLVGGAGGIGRSLAHWMVSHGAKNLVLMSRSAGTSETARALVSQLQEAGCRAKAVSCDVSSANSLTEALDLCDKDGFPPVRGVVQAAMFLQDSILEQMTLDDYRAAILPKVNATWNLHTRFPDASSLDFFVILSSVAGIVGYASQSNYSAGGAYEDALARWRASRGIPAVSVDLGAVKGVGYVAETAGVAGRMEKAGHMLLAEDKVLAVIESAILDPFHPQIVVGLNNGPGHHWDRHGVSQLGRDARFQALRWQQSGQSQLQNQQGGGKNGRDSLAAKLAEATSRADAEKVVGRVIAQKLADVFMIPVEDIDESKHPSQYGVDSLVAVELRNMLAHQAAADVSIFGIMQSPSLAGLAREVVSKSGHVPADVLVA
jgi:acyl transferase domain-containing protein/NADPH:quinone reductase-like Zn-dependent oxidoreductase/SAM-dependent methyltransferase